MPSEETGNDNDIGATGESPSSSDAQSVQPKKPRKLYSRMSKDKKMLKKVATLKVQGKTRNEIAQAVGCSPPTVARLMTKEEVKAMIEFQSQQLLKLVPRAIQNTESLINDFRRTERVKIGVGKDGKEIIAERPILSETETKLAWDANKKVLEAPGLMGGGQVSVQVGKLTINNTNNIISPNVLNLLKNIAGVQPNLPQIADNSADVEEIEYENVDD